MYVYVYIFINTQCIYIYICNYMPDIVKIVITSSQTSDTLDKNITDHDQVWPCLTAAWVVVTCPPTVSSRKDFASSAIDPLVDELMCWALPRRGLGIGKMLLMLPSMLPRSIDVYRYIQYIYMIILDLPGISMIMDLPGISMIIYDVLCIFGYIWYFFGRMSWAMLSPTHDGSKAYAAVRSGISDGLHFKTTRIDTLTFPGPCSRLLFRHVAQDPQQTRQKILLCQVQVWKNESITRSQQNNQLATTCINMPPPDKFQLSNKNMKTCHWAKTQWQKLTINNTLYMVCVLS